MNALSPRMAGLLLGLAGFASAFAQDAADNIIIVLDGSGSMGRPLAGATTDRMTAAQAALKQVLRTVPRETRIGLLVFSAKGVEDDWVYPLGPRDDTKLMQAIDRPIPGGGTPLGAYLKKGADRLLEERARQFGYGTFRLLVVTDGEAGDQHLVERFTPEVIARGITVDVIGVAMDQRHTLATRVHSYRSANDPASLTRAISEVFGEIGGRGQDVAGAEAFAELNSIPGEVAQAMIQALSGSGNQPIGEPPPASRTSADSPGHAFDQQAGASAQTASPPDAHRPVGVRGSWFLFIAGGMACLGFPALVVVWLIVRAVNKSRR
ncbi:MAG: VWA domain-containing protein [Verrucomicrobia bacterium]|nr:VWA domain-containing protein [Verrucomicrobiota bacterium]